MNERNANMNQLEHLDEIARDAWAGNYTRTGVLSTGERLYVALASGRMRGVDGDWVDDVQGRLADAVRASTKVQSLK